MRSPVRCASNCLAVALFAACTANDLVIGSARVSVITNGDDLDRDGYVIAVDSAVVRSLGPNGSFVVERLPSGSHIVELRGVDANCAVVGDNPRLASIVTSDAVDLNFTVNCVATGVWVHVGTTGQDLDSNGFSVAVDSLAPIPIGPNDSVRVSYLTAGAHVVQVGGIAANCAAGGSNPQSVSLAAGEIGVTHFVMTCGAVSGVVAISAATTGLDVDPNGYLVQLDGAASQPLPANGLLAFQGVTGGVHTITLSGATTNCAVAAGTTRTVTVAVGGAVRDTARTSFAVACGAVSGVLVLSASTAGLDPDSNGYSVSVDAGAAQPLLANGTLAMTGVAGGAHTITLSGASANCSDTAGTTRSVTLAVGGAVRDTVRTSFAFTCSAVSGVLLLSASTTGVDIDSGGYAVYVDAGAPWALPANGSVAITAVAGGNHSVLLSGATPNCSAAGGNVRNVSVTVGGATRDTVPIVFALSCGALTASLRITTATTGADLDSNGYTVYLDYGVVTRSVLDNGAMVIDGLSAGTHTVFLAGLDANCTLSGANLRSFTVATGGMTRDTAATSYAVACQAVGGSVRVTTNTSGVDPDQDGYYVHLVGLNYDRVQSVPASGVTSFSRVPPGAFFVVLSGLAMNCQAGGPTTQSGSIAAGDTLAVAFGVGCQLAPLLSVAHDSLGNTDLYRIRANGAVEDRLTTAQGIDAQPAWAPGGTQIAFMSDRTGSAQIYVMNADGTGQVPLTTGPGTSRQPTWSPDGSHIAFTGARGGGEDIYVMAANGSGAVPITTGGATQPAWSPDGLRIAFIASAGGHPNLFVMNADGSGRVRLSAAPYFEQSPDWSPDGKSILVSREVSCDYYYGCSDDLVAINADGTGEHRLTSGGYISSPRWSPDGHWVAYANSYCDYYSCSTPSVVIVSSDGASGMFVMPNAWDPSWKR